MLTAVLAFLLLLVVLLAIPVVLTFRVSWPQKARRELELQWAFGLVCVRFPTTPSSIPAADLEEVVQQFEPAANRPARKRKKRRTNYFAVIRQKPFRRRIFRYLHDCWRAIHKRDMYLRLRIGLDDPADTGQLWALIGPVAGVLSNRREVSLVIEPEFHEEFFEFDSSGCIKFVPLQLITLTIAMLCSPAIWQGIRKLG